MRLNIYSIKDEMPDKNLLEENIFLITPLKKGKFTIDLKQHNIVVESDFIVTLEWVKSYKVIEHGLCFTSLGSLPSPYFRTTSQAAWHKLKKNGLGFYFTAKY